MANLQLFMPRYAKKRNKIICRKCAENPVKSRIIKGFNTMIKILFICHGNICRSPMAESIFNYKIKQLGIADRFEVDSAGTSREELGHGVHKGTVKKLREMNIPVTPHSARQFSWVDYEYYDYIIAMDSFNVANILRIAGDTDYDGKVHKIMEYAGEDRDVADPWYTGNFDATYNEISRGVDGLLEELVKELN